MQRVLKPAARAAVVTIPISDEDKASIAEAEALAKRLTVLLDKIIAAKAPEELVKAMQKPLAVPLARAYKLINKDPTKIDEIIYASTRPGYVVQDSRNGVDLVGTERGDGLELKCSVAKFTKMVNKQTGAEKRSKTRKCSIVWQVGNAARPDRRDRLVRSIQAKTKNGGSCVIRVTDGFEKVLYECTLDHRFLVGYFQRVPLSKSPTHNMGCEQCARCHSFHRLDRLAAWSRKLVESATGTLSEEEWTLDVFVRVQRDCRPPK